IVLVRDHLFTAACVPVAWRSGVPLVLEVNSPAEESRLYMDEYWHVPWIPERLEGWKLRHADAVVTVSSALKAHFVARHGVPERKIQMVPNGADASRFHPAVAPDPEFAGVRAGGPVVGFVGSFQKWHGSELLCGMIADVGAARPQVRFLMVGDGPGREAVRRATSTLCERVVFAGRVPHARVPGLVACFDIGVMPESNFYGSPLKVIEWMAAGRALLAPRYGPPEDVIDDRVPGLRCAARDRAGLAAGVLRLVDDAELRERLGQAAAIRARTSLTWRDNARLVMAACEAAHARNLAAEHAAPQFLGA